MLKNDDWKYDVIPEIQNGKNVADFIDADIVARLEELEAEEERLEAAGFYDDDSEEDSDEDAIRTAASAIRDKKANIRMLNFQKNKLQNRPTIPRTVQHRTLSDMTAKLAEAGYDPSNLEERARVLAKARGLTTKRSAGEMEVDDDEADGEAAWGDEEEMDVEEGGRSGKKQKTSTSIVPKGKRVPGKDRQVAGLGSAEVRLFSRAGWFSFETILLTWRVSSRVGGSQGYQASRAVSAWSQHAGQGFRVRSSHPYQDAQGASAASPSASPVA